jgi:hypothetical protein
MRRAPGCRRSLALEPARCVGAFKTEAALIVPEKSAAPHTSKKHEGRLFPPEQFK